MGEPDDVVLQLVRDAARRELHLITAEARTSPEARHEAAAAAAWVQELDDPDRLGRGDGQVGSLARGEGTTSTRGRGS